MGAAPGEVGAAQGCMGERTAERRAQVVALASRGRSALEIADVLVCSRAHVYRTVARFVAFGREGLLDGRQDNGPRVVTDALCAVVDTLVRGSPRAYGYRRPTWTRELLIRVLDAETEVHVGVSTMSRILRQLQARRGTPKPIVQCPLSARHKRRRLAKLRQLKDTLPRDEVMVYEDEADIHLNPKVGLDWMARGQQNRLLTPGKNKKAYVAGTLDVRDGQVLWTGGLSKTSALFVAMLQVLDTHYTAARQIHVVLDNYGIHKSREVARALQKMPRIRLHFLPPYCPDHNPIERLWQDLHANVTRNHPHKTLEPLCDDVADYLRHASPWPRRPRSLLRRLPSAA